MSEMPSPPNEASALLGAFVGFEGLAPAVLEEVLAASAHVELVTGEPLVNQGDPADTVDLLLEGAAQVRVTGRDAPQVIAQIEAPDQIGEMGVLHGHPRTASVVATSRCLVLRIPADVYRRTVAARPFLPYDLQHLIEGRLRDDA